MNHGYLWCVNSDGVPTRVSSKEKPEPEDNCEWEKFPVTESGGCTVSIVKIACTPQSVFAIDRSGAVFIFANRSHLAIRQTVKTYSNQRWYPAITWCSHTLPTERSTFSNEDGSMKMDFETFSLRSDGWRWEEPWVVASDSRKYDKEGWQYAFNFGNNPEWTSRPKKLSFVRRRLFKRTMRYVAVETWIQIPLTDSSHVFLDICAGNFANGNENFDLFVLSERGQIYRRRGIERNNPEGIEWVKIEGVRSGDDWEDLCAICSSPSYRSLLALSWDGRLFARTGMDKQHPEGQGWTTISLPGNLPITGFSLGNKSLWIVSVEGKVFTSTVSLSSSGVSTLSPFRDAGEGMCRMSVSLNDQVLAISNSSELLHIRTDISQSEPFGRRWVPIQVTGSTPRTLQVDVGTCYFTHKSIPPHWTDANFVPISLDLQKIRKAEWRSTILYRLNEVHERSWSVFKEDSDGPEENGGESVGKRESGDIGRTRTARVAAIVKVTGLLNWSDGTLTMDECQITVHLKRGTTVKKSLDAILSVYPTSQTIGRCSLAVLFSPLSHTNAISLAFSSEEERDQWIEYIEKEIRNVSILYPRDRLSQWAWSIRVDGTLRCHLMSIMRNAEGAEKQSGKITSSPSSLSLSPTFIVDGHFNEISVGVEKIVWAVANNGTVYVLDPHFDPLNEELEYHYVQHDSTVEYVVEYQKYAVFRGYVSFSGCSGGVHAWSTLDGRVADKNMRLPKGWRWDEEEWVMARDWEYAEMLDGEYGESEKKARARRRVWSRRRVYEKSGPWIRVDAPPAQRVTVQREFGDRILVWLITVSGDVLVRYGCTRSNPQGDVWNHLTSDFTIKLLSLSSLTRVWAVTNDDRLIMRECGSPSDIDKVEWQEVVISGHMDLPNVIDLCANKSGVWVLGKEGMIAIVGGPSGYLLYRIRHTHPISRIFCDRQQNLYALTTTGVLRKTGTLKEVRRSVPLAYEIPWEVIEMGYVKCCDLF